MLVPFALYLKILFLLALVIYRGDYKGERVFILYVAWTDGE